MMKQIRRRSLLLGGAGLLAGGMFRAAAQVPMTGAGRGKPGGVYQGPGNVLAADHYWGTRAYTLASIGANAIRLRSTVGLVEADFVTVAGGGLDMTAINSFIGTNGACGVLKLYDQVSTAHKEFTVLPSFIQNGLGSLPVLRFSAGAATTGATTVGMSISAPWSVMAFCKRTGGVTVSGNIVGNTNVNCTLGYSGSADTVLLYASGAGLITAAAIDNAYHSLIGVAVSGTNNSKLIVDGAAPVSGDTSAAAWTGASTLGAVPATSQGCPDMDFVEDGIYSSAITASGANLSSNQHTYFG